MAFLQIKGKATVCRGLCSSSSMQKQWKKTLFLPKSVFNIHGFGKDAIPKYAGIAAKWNTHYEKQLSHGKGNSFWLHDGPPYANGKLHAGHALNKLMKDTINRHHLMKGDRVLYRPGWDCHGLPIELAVQKSMKYSKQPLSSPLEIRKACKNEALAVIADQKKDFMSWGIVGDWKNCYQTLDFDYELSELELFVKLVERNLVVRKHQPVYWSPSSRTAIAESELEYNNNHRSPSAFVAFKLCTTNGKTDDYLVVWTTTIWSLPANEAVAFSPNLDYTWLSDNSSGHRRYLVATVAADRLSAALGNKLDVSKQHVSHSDLAAMTYQHPFLLNKLCNVIPSGHVTADLGSGLVHVAPVHGHEDWELGVKYKLPIRTTVSDDGRFTDAAGLSKLTGKSAMHEDDGIATIREHLNSDKNKAHELAMEHIVHSYPYDWRTKAPIMIRASKQWFIDLREVRHVAIKALNDVTIQPENLRGEFVRMLQTRDHWCISRQRCWGVPIPVLFEMPEEKPVLNVNVLRSILETFKAKKTTDCWWSLDAKDFVTDDAAVKSGLNKSDLTLGKDILDVWFDSGSSWFAALPSNVDVPNRADCYVEGVDQFRGWFLSSLLLSCAVNETAPYKRLFWHGFAVDDSGKKMSKSLGNVVGPTECILGSVSRQLPAVGVDGLRLWAIRSQSESLVKLGSSSLADSKQLLLKFRNSFSFLLGNLKSTAYTPLPYESLCLVDQYFLHRLGAVVSEVLQLYDAYHFRRAVHLLDCFFTTELSQFYFTISKDRLYCEAKDSHRRRSALTVLQLISQNMTSLLAPLLPFTVEEVAFQINSAPQNSENTVLSLGYRFSPDISLWHRPHLNSVVSALLAIRERWLQAAAPKDSSDFQLTICFGENAVPFLNDLTVATTSQNDLEIDMTTTEKFVAELLHVNKCVLSQGKFGHATEGNFLVDEMFNYDCENVGSGPSINYSLNWLDVSKEKCSRCRRFQIDNSSNNLHLCKRCSSVCK